MLSQEQIALLQCALNVQALKFGNFTLKSGRQSPYFFNAGAFNTGAALTILAQAYAAKIVASKIEFDVLFGPAYKGIPLVAAVAAVLELRYRISIPFAFNRKEEKTHGEGGFFVGADVREQRILILDDVLTAGTAIRQSLQMLRQEKAKPVAVLVTLDRQEAIDESHTALSSLAANENLFCEAIVNLDDLLAFSAHEKTLQQNLPLLEEYRKRFSVKAKP